VINMIDAASTKRLIPTLLMFSVLSFMLFSSEQEHEKVNEKGMFLGQWGYAAQDS